MVGGQDELVFDGDSMIVTADGELLARAPQFAEHLLVHDLDRCRPPPPDAPDGDARSGRHARAHASQLRRRRCAPARPADRPPAGSPSGSPTRPRSGRRWCWGCATTSARTASARWCSACPAASTPAVVAAIAVDALGPDQVVGVSMPSQHSSEHSRDDAADLAKRTGLDYRIEPIQPMVDAFLANLVAVRARGGEPAGPGARRDPDGAVQPGGSPRAHHRQQERAGGRLLHPLRRLGRRLQPAQGRAEDAGVAAGPVAQRRGGRARRAGADPGELDQQAAERRAAPRPARHRLAARLRRCSTRSWPATSTATWAATTWSPPATTRRWSTGCCAWSTSPSTSAASRRRAPKISIKAFGRDRRLPITNRFRERADVTPRPIGACEIFH